MSAMRETQPGTFNYVCRETSRLTDRRKPQVVLLVKTAALNCFMILDQVNIPSPVERSGVVARDGAARSRGDVVNPMPSGLERQCRRYGGVCMRDRKPRYDRAVSGDGLKEELNLPTRL